MNVKLDAFMELNNEVDKYAFCCQERKCCAVQLKIHWQNDYINILGKELQKSICSIT